jgi:NUBPL iron-transfer P-loop NTPase/Gamma-butyrobetaine hydroxylase-like, N-terminal
MLLIPLLQVITQLLVQTDWGELDHLIIDMPPGTGDIHITLCQTVQLSGAVVVTTPQKLSYVDVVKGIDMFSALRVPTLAVVENMAYFDCEHGTRYRPFGPGHTAELKAEYGITEAFQLPLSERIASGSDSGAPIVAAQPAAAEAAVYASLARAVVAGALQASNTAAPAPVVKFDAARGVITVAVVGETSAQLYRIPPRELRVREARTGLKLVPAQADVVPRDVVPLSFDVKGNYAVGIVWSDGHKADIYPYDVLIKIGEELLAGAGTSSSTSSGTSSSGSSSHQRQA